MPKRKNAETVTNILTQEEILKAMAGASWEEGMTPNEMFFAARPELIGTMVDGKPLSGSAYAMKCIHELVLDKKLVLLDVRRKASRVYRTTMKPQDTANGVLEVREIAGDDGRAPLEELLDTGSVQVSAAARTTQAIGIDPVAEAFQIMLQKPLDGSRSQIVQVQSADGIRWARAAGIPDIRIAETIVKTTGLNAEPKDLLHLIRSVPSRPSANAHA